MIGTAILILLLLALCGFIAYMGDLLGRRLGKKRLSVFGLRPKHTAILLTIVTGVLIAGVTFGMAMLSVPGFRSVVTQGERLAAQNARLDGENARLASEITRSTEQYQSLSERNRKLAGDNGKLIEQNRKLEDGNKQLASRNLGLTTENGKLTSRNSTLQGENTTLAGKNVTLERESRKLGETNIRLAKEQQRLGSEAKRLKGNITSLHSELALLRRMETNLRTEQYVFRRGQQVAQRVILKDAPPDVLREAVKAAVFESTEVVDKREFVDGYSWVKPKDYPTGRSDRVEAIQDWVVNRALRARGDDLAIRVVAAANCVAGERVQLRLEWYVNDRVFRKDEVIASRLVDGAAEVGDILSELIFFLKTQVGPAALRKDMAPDPEDTFGRLSYTQLLQDCQKIKSQGGFVRVVALAKQDTLRSGPLNVYLDVRPADQRAAGIR